MFVQQEKYSKYVIERYINHLNKYLSLDFFNIALSK